MVFQECAAPASAILRMRGAAMGRMKTSCLCSRTVDDGLISHILVLSPPLLQALGAWFAQARERGKKGVTVGREDCRSKFYHIVEF